MNTASWPLRLLLLMLVLFVLAGPAASDLDAGPPPLQANKLFDYIRGNRARMVQITTLGLVIGLVILMTATRKQ